MKNTSYTTIQINLVYKEEVEGLSLVTSITKKLRKDTISIALHSFYLDRTYIYQKPPPSQTTSTRSKFMWVPKMELVNHIHNIVGILVLAFDIGQFFHESRHHNWHFAYHTLHFSCLSSDITLAFNNKQPFHETQYHNWHHVCELVCVICSTSHGFQ